jgi:uncharacterized protein YlxP (DUF503 family)
MRIGVAVVELHVHGSRSLKEKRGVVRSIIQRLRNRYNLSVAEVAGQETWQRALLGISLVGSEAPKVRRNLEAAIDFIDSLHLAEIRSSESEILEVEQGDLAEWGSAILPWEED